MKFLMLIVWHISSTVTATRNCCLSIICRCYYSLYVRLLLSHQTVKSTQMPFENWPIYLAHLKRLFLLLMYWLLRWSFSAFVRLCLGLCLESGSLKKNTISDVEWEHIEACAFTFVWILRASYQNIDHKFFWSFCAKSLDLYMILWGYLIRCISGKQWNMRLLLKIILWLLCDA